jgi:hypothetical protein
MDGDTYLQIISAPAAAFTSADKDIPVTVHKTVTLEFGVTEQQMDDTIDQLYAEAERLELQSHAGRVVKPRPHAADEPADLADEQHLLAVQLVRARQIIR